MEARPASFALSEVLGAHREAMPLERTLAIVSDQAGTGLCPAAVAGLEASLVEEPGFVATVATTLGDHEGLRPPVRRPA